MDDYETEYLEFKHMGCTASGKTHTWAVVSRRHRDVLGSIRWYPLWHQYCFYPNEGTIWNKDCLKEIQWVLNKVTDEHRRKVVNP